MTKKNILKTLDMSSYVAFIVAAVLALIFEFVAELVIFKLAIILFAAGFLMLCVLCSLKLYFMKNEIREDDELLVDKTKEKKSWLITKLVLYVCGFVLMIAFLCLF